MIIIYREKFINNIVDIIMFYRFKHLKITL